jgi:hypothetical protein
MVKRATLWQLAQGVALIITGVFAASGASLSCALRNQAAYGSVHPPFMSQGSGLTTYLVLFALMAGWIGLVALFAWRNRSPASLTLAAIALAIFALSALNVLRMAYPVCNAF